MLTSEQQTKIDKIFNDSRDLIDAQKTIELMLRNHGIFKENDRFLNLPSALTKEKKISTDVDKRLTTYLGNLNSFVHAVNYFFNEHYQTGLINISISRATRRAERIDMFILWGQRLLRWVVTVSIAIFLYSCLVWVSEKYSFIKIPVKDFFQ